MLKFESEFSDPLHVKLSYFSLDTRLSLFHIVEILLLRRLIGHLQYLDSLGVWHGSDKRLGQLRKCKMFDVALDQDGDSSGLRRSNRTVGSSSLTCRSRCIEPLVGEAKEKMGDVAQGRRRVQNFGIVSSNLKN